MKSMQANSQTIAVVLIIFAAASGLAFKQSMASSTVPGQSDQQSIDIANATLASMGGEEAWNSTRYVSWKFFGGRLHVWDKWTGNHRMESENGEGDQIVSLINISRWDGRIFKNGVEVSNPEELATLLNSAFRS